MKTITRAILAASLVILPVVAVAQIGVTWLSALTVLACFGSAIQLLTTQASQRRS